MEYTELIVEDTERIRFVKFNRPKYLNAINIRLSEELVDALIAADRDDQVKVLVITGVGRAFCAGMDLSEAAESVKVGKPMFSPIENMAPKQMSVPWTPWIMRNMRKPIIAAINGVAIGAGFTIALACDIRIASEQARMGAAFAPVNLIPEFGSTYNLPRLVGIAKACELVFTSKIIEAKEAKEIGLVNEVVAADNLEASAHQMAATIAQWPSLAIQLAKRALYQGLDSDLASQLQFETLGMGICTRTEDHQEGVRAFLEKRKPVFKER